MVELILGMSINESNKDRAQTELETKLSLFVQELKVLDEADFGVPGVGPFGGYGFGVG